MQTQGALVVNCDAKFDPGKVVCTPGVLALLVFRDIDVDETLGALLARHLEGDWGDVDAQDKSTNDMALIAGERLLSSYKLPGGEKVWLITEWDRSVTTFLLPSEY